MKSNNISTSTSSTLINTCKWSFRSGTQSKVKLSISVFNRSNINGKAMTSLGSKSLKYRNGTKMRFNVSRKIAYKRTKELLNFKGRIKFLAKPSSN